MQPERTRGIKVLTDEVEEHPVLGFEIYAECIVDIIRGIMSRNCPQLNAEIDYILYSFEVHKYYFMSKD